MAIIGMPNMLIVVKMMLMAMTKDGRCVERNKGKATSPKRETKRDEPVMSRMHTARHGGSCARGSTKRRIMRSEDGEEETQNLEFMRREKFQ